MRPHFDTLTIAAALAVGLAVICGVAGRPVAAMLNALAAPADSASAESTPPACLARLHLGSPTI